MIWKTEFWLYLKRECFDDKTSEREKMHMNYCNCAWESCDAMDQRGSAACGTTQLRLGDKDISFSGIDWAAALLAKASPITFMCLPVRLAVSNGIAFILSFFTRKGKRSAPSAPEVPAVETEPRTIYCPVEGNVITRENIPDATFASGVLGDGVGIEPASGVVVAPFDGKISTVAETKHAVGLSSYDGMEVLIHVGVDTVAMEGKGFETQVATGDDVKAGQVLMRFSIEEIGKAGYNTTTTVLVCNSDKFESFQVEKTGISKRLDKIITCK